MHGHTLIPRSWAHLTVSASPDLPWKSWLQENKSSRTLWWYLLLKISWLTVICLQIERRGGGWVRKLRSFKRKEIHIEKSNPLPAFPCKPDHILRFFVIWWEIFPFCSTARPTPFMPCCLDPAISPPGVSSNCSGLCSQWEAPPSHTRWEQLGNIWRLCFHHVLLTLTNRIWLQALACASGLFPHLNCKVILSLPAWPFYCFAHWKGVHFNW